MSKNKRRRAAWIIPAIALFGMTTCLFAAEDKKSSFDPPVFELNDVKTGAAVDFSKIKGQKPALLYFWATWCQYCVAARPGVVDLRNSVSKDDLEILAIDVGGGDSLAKVKKFEESHPSPLTVLYDSDQKVTRSYQVQGIPHFVLLDKTGAVKYRGNSLPPNPMSLVKP